MADRAHLEILSRGAWIWNDWREKNPAVTPDLRGAYLRELDLSRFDFRKADLRKAMLMAADLSYTDLRGADLSFADLRFAGFHRTDVRGASFREAQGVEEGVLKAAQGRSKRSKQLRAAAIGLCAFLALGLLWLLGRPILTALRPHLPASLAGGVEREQPDQEAAETPSNGGEAPALDGPAEVEAAITALRWPGWELNRVEVAVARIKVRVNRDRVSEDVLVPTIAGICGAVLNSKERPPSDEILVLNETGGEGWSYQTPEQCAELLRAPLTMMRLAIAGNSRPVRFTPGTD